MSREEARKFFDDEILLNYLLGKRTELDSDRSLSGQVRVGGVTPAAYGNYLLGTNAAIAVNQVREYETVMNRHGDTLFALRLARDNAVASLNQVTSRRDRPYIMNQTDEIYGVLNPVTGATYWRREDEERGLTNLIHTINALLREMDSIAPGEVFNLQNVRLDGAIGARLSAEEATARHQITEALVHQMGQGFFTALANNTLTFYGTIEAEKREYTIHVRDARTGELLGSAVDISNPNIRRDITANELFNVQNIAESQSRVPVNR
jgi:hypothetical protein